MLKVNFSRLGGFACWIPIIFLMGSFSVFAQTSAYLATVMQERKEKDQSFRTEKESPIPVKERKRFKGLRYFPVDSTFRVEATLSVDSVRSLLQMKDSKGRQPMFIKYGMLRFFLKGESFSLPVYQGVSGMQNNYLFLPFTDLTSGETTYEAGRYMMLELPKNDKIVLDFNQAYNPFCAYSDLYACPIPPAENRLPIAIEAGEKLYKSH